ncbi:ATPase, P-type (transporting), HAD superfamily, subfamily IC/heavy metal translocating P-type ATPase [Micromonospora echinaurantiaca]|uniref:ATPase, P-type (Transporting), HAD superfamily, subfamily IC/heavy metal translocating P-type ATPase n=1 Tax=Micromonospora echinaurantiaca TaxID=47857 RepID=A0A1C5J6C9_9ACTN|nr:ATPase, P-type (transporting), HAD superfamily, subfamily IC/heavy metal translocating P-type ATPase [Micromonospora echinaurantiaca]
MRRAAARWATWAPLVGSTAVVLVGAGFWLAGRRDAANLIWAALTLVALLPAAWSVLRDLWRRRFGVDVIAVLALAGALGVGEYLAGAVIAVMLVTGRSLEAYAQRRATRDLRALLARAPRTARRRTADGGIEVVPVDRIAAGDRLLVGPGDVVGVDGVLEAAATLDESVVTGESQLVQRAAGEAVASGVVNAGAGFGLRATTSAAGSTYAGIVRLAEEATARKAPMVRLADRYAAAFVPFTLALAGLGWLLSGELARAVAVLVVATPCPLLLATPIAIVSGLSRTARRGVLVRDGGSLELLGRARTLLVDKTGTLTAGRPRAAETVAGPGVDRDEVLRLAASVEQLSPHVLATALVGQARARGLPLTEPTEVTEEPGRGVTGRVDGRLVRVGQFGGELPDWAERARQRAELAGSSVVWVGDEAGALGAVLLEDPVRPDARRTVRRLRAAGLRRIVMVTGDRPGTAEQVAQLVGVDDVLARCTPREKVDRVRAEAGRAVTVMVGDGVNDAPALAEAHVGVAMGATGATASADVADAVLTVDRLDRLADAVEIARYARRIAVQSAAVGMGLAVLAMLVAAAGRLPPVAGAFLQEGIDVLVIVNALRALGGGLRRREVAPGTRDLLDRFAGENAAMRDVLAGLRDTADLVATRPDSPECLPALRAAHRRLTDEVLPHAAAEERQLYPALAGPLGSAEATSTMSRAHVEIRRQVDRIGAHLAGADDGRLRADQVTDLLATLYGLEAVLRLHLAQEEEDYFSLAPPADAGH